MFADLGYAHPDTHLLKAQLVSRIDEILNEQKLTQIEAAKIMGLSQPDVSRLLKGQFREISVERIMRLLVRLGCKIDIAKASRAQTCFLADSPSTIGNCCAGLG